jgi:hypothetical protein
MLINRRILRRTFCVQHLGQAPSCHIRVTSMNVVWSEQLDGVSAAIPSRFILVWLAASRRSAGAAEMARRCRAIPWLCRSSLSSGPSFSSAQRSSGESKPQDRQELRNSFSFQPETLEASTESVAPETGSVASLQGDALKWLAEILANR